MSSAALALIFVTTLAAEGKPTLSWSRDYDRAFTEAEERSAPVLIHFRGANCGSRSGPGAMDGRAGAGMATGTSRPRHDTELTDCDLMQQEVWENARIAASAQRFLPVLTDGGDQTLNVKYQVVVNPTTLITDPWGNEMLRVAGYLDPEKVDRILEAVPRDFASLAPWGRALRQDPTSLRALVGAAAYYEGQRLRQVSERLYDKALGTPGASDAAARRQVAIARGLNLLMMARDKDAAGVFQKEIDQAPGGAGTDALLLGLVNAHLQGGRRKEAEAVLRLMQTSYPESPYTARAKQNVEAKK
jgi:hypothetical protein